MSDSLEKRGSSMTPELRIGKNSTVHINGDGAPLLARSSKHSEAKVNACARAAYGSLMMNLMPYDRASPKLKAKSLLIAEAVLDAVDRFENHFP